MNQYIRAIFDNGVFRPLEALDLPDGMRVSLHINDDDFESEITAPATIPELIQQQDALQAMFQGVDRLSQVPRNDGLSGRNHDQILYGIHK